MGRVYELLDEKLAAYKRSNPKDFEYDAVPAQVQAIHRPHFPQIESLYRAALSKAQTDSQRQRLQMFGDNLVLLHWQLRKAGWIENPNESSFYRSDADFKTFIEQNSARPSISKTNAKPELFLSPQLRVIETKPVSVDK